VKYARKVSTRKESSIRRGLRKETERRPRSSEVRYFEDSRRDDPDREYRQLDRRRRDRSRQREQRTVNRPRRPNDRVRERKPRKLRSRSVEYRTSFREETIRKSNHSPVRRRDYKAPVSANEDDYKTYSRERRSDIIFSPHRERPRYKPRIRSLSREKRRSYERIPDRPKECSRNLSRDRGRSSGRNHCRDKKQLKRSYPPTTRDRSNRERQQVREGSLPSKRYPSSLSVEPKRTRRERSISFDGQQGRKRKENAKQPPRSLSRERRVSEDRGRPRVRETSLSSFPRDSVGKRQSGKLKSLSNSRTRYQTTNVSKLKQPQDEERRRSELNEQLQSRSQSRPRPHNRDKSPERGESQRTRSPYDDRRSSRTSDSGERQRSKDRSRSLVFEEGRSETSLKSELRKMARSPSCERLSQSRSLEVKERKKIKNTSRVKYEAEQEGSKEKYPPKYETDQDAVKEAYPPRLDKSVSPRHQESRERNTSKSSGKSPSPEKDKISRSRSHESEKKHSPQQVQKEKIVIKIEDESDSSVKLLKKRKRSKKRRKKRRRKSKRRKSKRSKKSIWSKLTSAERAAIPSSERAAMKKRAREEENSSSSGSDRGRSSSTGSRSKSSTPQRKRRRRHRRRKLRAMRELLGHNQIPVLALASQPVIKKQVRHGSGMVFDGFNWYPKGSQEALVTQKKIAMKQPMYGPNGSRANSGMGLATPVNGQRMATQAIAELIAKRQWVV